MFLHEITHKYLKNHFQFFDTSKTKDLYKNRGNDDLLTKVKFQKTESSSPLICFKQHCNTAAK